MAYLVIELLETVTRSSRNRRILNHYCSNRGVGAVESGKFAYRTARDSNKEQ